MYPSRIGSTLAGGIALLLGAVMVAGLVGWFAGAAWGWASVCVVITLAFAYHLRELLRLGRWLEGDAPVPRAFGTWDEMLGLVERSRREGARREAELVLALERWKSAARALPDGVVLLEGERIEWCNESASIQLGIDPAKDEGHFITHLVRSPEFAHYLVAEDYSHPLELRPPDGRVLSVQAVNYGDGLRLLLSRDITRFDRVDRVRREFVANVSHELRTPLTVVAGFVETMRDDTPAAHPHRHGLDLMQSQTQRMQRLVEDLLTLSSLESAPPPPLEESVNLHALVERVAADARALSHGRHRIAVENRPGIIVRGSEAELASAFGNLVSNAVRYTPEGGEIGLALRGDEDGAEFEVRDSGIGIPEEHLPRLTERFYRVDRGRSRETGGTGLGLAIVKHALARHGATLDIASRLGEGSRFTARFSRPRVRVLAASTD